MVKTKEKEKILKKIIKNRNIIKTKKGQNKNDSVKFEGKKMSTKNSITSANILLN